MKRFLIFDYVYGTLEGDTADFMPDGARCERDAVRELCRREGREPARIDWMEGEALDDPDGLPMNWDRAYVVYSFPADAPIDINRMKNYFENDLDFSFKNDGYITQQGGKLTCIVFTLDSLSEKN
jgi:hypothetical protein